MTRQTSHSKILDDTPAKAVLVGGIGEVDIETAEVVRIGEKCAENSEFEDGAYR